MVKQELQKLFDWLYENIIKLPEDKEPQPYFSNALIEIESFGKFAKNQVCPRCGKKEGFTLNGYERGRNGWELNVKCKCGFTGVVNTTGFRFEAVE